MKEQLDELAWVMDNPAVAAQSMQPCEHATAVLEANTNIMEMLTNPANRAFLDSHCAPCVKCGSECKLYEKPHPRKHCMVIHAAGASCKDWSRRGLRRGLSGKTARPFLIWLAERVRRQEDIVIEECTEDADEHIIEKWMKPTHYIIVMVFGPDDIGWPVQRPRKWFGSARLVLKLRLDLSSERASRLSRSPMWPRGPRPSKLQVLQFRPFRSGFVGSGDQVLPHSIPAVKSFEVRLTKETNTSHKARSAGGSSASGGRPLSS